ncbi:unnamed protein product [Schistosoma mattheei]|uniref:Uncharacterized protein n=1 Tax=Schistosoma mattheei TaxID=31246 RepID=A0A3P8E5G2_9TREM|nr:unnamed protein product [Schistosoma mattheei]
MIEFIFVLINDGELIDAVAKAANVATVVISRFILISLSNIFVFGCCITVAASNAAVDAVKVELCNNCNVDDKSPNDDGYNDKVELLTC